MGSRHEIEEPWELAPGTVGAMESVSGARIRPISQREAGKDGPWTIGGEKVIIDLHPLPGGRVWINATCLYSGASRGLIPQRIGAEPTFEDPQKVVFEDREGTKIIIPKNRAVVFQRPGMGT